MNEFVGWHGALVPCVRNWQMLYSELRIKVQINIGWLGAELSEITLQAMNEVALPIQVVHSKK